MGNQVGRARIENGIIDEIQSSRFLIVGDQDHFGFRLFNRRAVVKFQQVGIIVVFCPNDFYIYSRKSKLLLDLYIKRNAMIMRGLIIIKVNETEQ